MERHIAQTLLLLIYHLLAIPAGAQKLVVEQSLIDVGKTGFQMPVTASFTLNNKGPKGLTIDSVKTDCGCTQVVWPRNSVGAGEKFNIQLTYDARQLGHFVKQAVVYTRAARQPLVLRMKGVVLTELHDYSKFYPFDMGGLLTDANAVEFDDVNKGDVPEREIHVLNNTTDTLTPNLQHLPPFLTAIASPERLAPGQAGTVTLTLSSQQLNSYGLTQSSIYLAKHLGEKVSSETEIPVSIVLLPDLKAFQGGNRQYAPRLELSEDSLRLGMLNGKLHKSGTIILSNTGHSTLIISSLQMFTGGMKVTLGKRELQPGQSTKLRVQADRDQLLKERSRPRVLMITNDPDRPKVVININCK